MDKKLVACLIESSRNEAVPWPVCSFDEDFILVSEFSELEGPRPVLTIPEDGGASFNKNTFAVRIMSVDCTAPITVDSGRVLEGDSFKTVGDTQVVLVEPAEGAVAYVHHFTLYDIHARGFVRPYCMAYITNQHSKIMNSFAIFRNYFTRISSFFKFGNGLVFLQDLYLRHGFLDYLQRKLLENLCNKPVASFYELPRDLKGFSFENIEEYMKDSAELQSVVKSYILENDLFDEQRIQLKDQTIFLKISETENETEGTPSLEELDVKFENVDPTSVGISSGRKFDKQLRGLDALCEPSKEDSFKLLKDAYNYFRKMKFLDVGENGNIEKEGGISSQHHADEAVSGGSHVHKFSKQFFLIPKARCMSGYKFSGRRGSEYSGSGPYGSGSSFDACSSWTISSYFSQHDSFEVIKATHSSSDDEFLSVKESSSSLSASTFSRPSISTGFSEYQLSLTAAECIPGTAKRISSDALSKFKSKVSSFKSDEVDFGLAGSPYRVSWEDGGTTSGIDREHGPIKEAERNKGTQLSENGVLRQNSMTSTDSSRSSSSSTSWSKVSEDRGQRSGSKNRVYRSAESCGDKKSIGTVSASSKGSGISSSNFFHLPSDVYDNRHEISLMNLRRIYTFLPHLVYSLMIGRPVVVSAERSNKQMVHSIIVSLLPCVPGFPRNKDFVIFWTKGPFLLSNLATVKLVGLAKTRGHDPVPKSIANYVSLLDFEDSTLRAPMYNGTYLNALFDREKDWPSEAVFLETFHAAQLELSAQAFMMFSWYFLDGEIKPNTSRQDNRNDASGNSSHLSMKIDPQQYLLFRFAAEDVRIIKYLLEILKEELLDDYIKSISNDSYDSKEVARAAFSCIDQAGRLSHCETPSVELNVMKCTLFNSMSGGKKK